MVSTFNQRPMLVHIDNSTASTVDGKIDSETTSLKAFQAYLILLYEHLLKDIYNLLYIGPRDHRGLW